MNNASLISLLFVALVSAAHAEDVALPGLQFRDAAVNVESRETAPYEQRSISSERGGGRALRSTLEFDLTHGSTEVSAVQFLLKGPAALAESIDLSSCSTGLPETHMGSCKIKPEGLLFYAFSPVNAALPEPSVFRLRFNQPVDSGQIRIEGLVMSDTEGSELTRFRSR